MVFLLLKDWHDVLYIYKKRQVGVLDVERWMSMFYLKNMLCILKLKLDR